MTEVLITDRDDLRPGDVLRVWPQGNPEQWAEGPHNMRESVRPIVTAAAPLIAVQVRKQIIETLRAERDEVTGSRGPQDEPIAAESAFLSGLDHAIEVLEDERALPTERRDTWT